MGKNFKMRFGVAGTLGLASCEKGGDVFRVVMQFQATKSRREYIQFRVMEKRAFFVSHALFKF